jgi:class 3 adenylate cyclase
MNLFFIFSVSDVGDLFRQSAIAPLEFRFREWVGQAPSKHPRLKVVIYGDRAKRELGIQELLPLKTWQQVLTDLSARQPHAIYIDKFFSLYRGERTDAAQFKAALRGTTATPIIAAAVLGVTPDKDSVSIERLFKDWSVSEDVILPEGSRQTLIGPHADIADAFSGLGHIRVQDSTTAVEPAWRVRETQKLLPQLSLAASQNVLLQQRKLILDGKKIDLDRHGRIPVNFLDRNKLFSGSVSFLNLLAPETRQVELQKVQAGDEVLLLPSMYAGSTDVRSSPIGLVEGGIYHASLLNSVVANLFLRPVLQNPWLWYLALLATAAGSAFAALACAQPMSIALVVSGSLGFIVLGFFGFAWARLLLDWHILFALYFTNGTLSALVRGLLQERQALRVSTALEGMVPASVLETLKNKPELLTLRPRSLHVTLLFIDVEGFSLRTKNLDSVDVFQILHAQLGLVAETVHQYGGVIDKNLGDGLLCYFGYDLASAQGFVQQSPQQAARRALRCAVEIQRQAATLTAFSRDGRSALGSLLPLRIGVNSGDVFLGNLGPGRRVDFTIVGEAVNTGKRLEDACETFRVLVGESTYQLLFSQGEGFIEGVKWHKRKMSIKHQIDLLSAWECDPFVNDRETYEAALRVLRLGAGLAQEGISDQSAPRVTLYQGSTIVGQLIHPSRQVFLLKTQDYFCRKVILQLRLVTENTELNAEVERRHLSVLNFQILFGRVLEQGQYLHEVTPINLPTERIDELSVLLLRSP